MAENASPSQVAPRVSRKRLRLVRTSRMRFETLFPILKAKAAEASGKSVMMLSGLGRELATSDERIRYVADLAQVSSRTLYRWLHLFEHEGFEGLKDKPRRDKGASKAFRNRGAALSVVVCEFLAGRTAARIHRKLCDVWPRLYRGSRVPSYASVCSLLASLAPLKKRPRAKTRSAWQVRDGG